MSDHILLGETASAPPAPLFVDVDTLLSTRLLVTASSGGGKSYLLRRLLEQVFRRCPFIVIDPEGEFATLRERFDVLLVGKGGDTPAVVKSAPLLARKVLEAGISTVCDLFEMLPADRHRWVEAFLNGLIDAPKDLWRPFVVVIDEAHVFNPEKGAGESCASDAVVSLATRGRKRGFGAVLATQRLGKLRKDTAAELQNVLVGRTVLDIDRERAAEALGVARKERPEFSRQLKALAPGRFFAQGRAFDPGATEPVLVQIGKVQTTHPQAGVRTVEPPPPSETVRHLFARFKDLPREAERKEATEAELRDEVNRLNAQIKRLTGELDSARTATAVPSHLLEAIESAVADAGQAFEAASEAQRSVSRLTSIASGSRVITTASEPRSNGSHEPQRPRPTQATPAEDGLSRDGARRMLKALASRYPKPLTTSQVGTLVGIASTTGTFRQYVAMLKRAGYVVVEAKVMGLTDAGLNAAGPVDRPAGARELLSTWMEKLDRKGARDILDLFAREHGPMTKDQVAKAIAMGNAGTFRQYMAKLVRNDLIQKTRGGFVINPELAL